MGGFWSLLGYPEKNEDSHDGDTSGDETSGNESTTEESESETSSRQPTRTSDRPSRRPGGGSNRPSKPRPTRPGRRPREQRAWHTSGQHTGTWDRTADRWLGGYGQQNKTEYQVGGFAIVFGLILVSMVLNLVWAITILSDTIPAVDDPNDADMWVEWVVIAAIVFGALPLFIAIASGISAAYCCDDTEFALMMGCGTLFFSQIPMFVLHMVYVGYITATHLVAEKDKPNCTELGPALACSKDAGVPTGDLFIATAVFNVLTLLCNITVQIFVCFCGNNQRQPPTQGPVRPGPGGRTQMGPVGPPGPPRQPGVVTRGYRYDGY